ncbi:MAG TPA: UPF0182 family protein [Chloroflexota bacterium]|nr:UPF0182 family protein [Chloroflexota bacterium]
MARWQAKRPSAQRVVAVFRLLLLGGLVALLLLAMLTVDRYTDWLWFESLGYTRVYLTRLLAQVAIFVVAALLFFGLLAGNVLLARRLARRFERRALPHEDGLWAYLARMSEQLGDRAPYARTLNAGILAAGGFFAVVLGLTASRSWLTFLSFVHARPFGVADPLFGRDVSFYVFTLPFMRFVHGWLVTALLLVAVGTLAVYAVILVYELNLDVERLIYRLGPAIRAHLLLLLAAFLVLLAIHHVLDLFELVYSARSLNGAIRGAGYADVHAQVPAQWAMAALALAAAALAVVTIFTRGFRFLALGLGGWLVGALALGVLYPTFVQNFDVRPNELARETPYIEANIEATLHAYNLAGIEERSFPAEDAVTPAEVRANPQTIDNIRLWDHRQLLETYNQIQVIRQYYEFAGLDVDRYVINGQYRQVMLGARELVQSKLPPQAQTWVNQKLVYTHGYGVAMSPVNATGAEGLPQFFIKDLPPTGDVPVERPEIYYGERDRPDQYVVVHTAASEFDYPRGNDVAQTTVYQGRGGVELNSYWRRLAYAWQFHDGNLLLNTDLRPDSQVLYRRNVRQRVATLAPFLRLDDDPYLVVVDGRLVWMLDAYTTSNRYPYAQPTVTDTAPLARFNYVRNSVKVTVDAYDGTTTFYVADPSDPLIQTYATIFPDLFVPLDTMSPGLRAHLRYPEDLFKWQTRMYLSYHVQSPAVFYNREDLWSVPREREGQDTQPRAIDPYYTIMRIPGEAREEFLLMLPLVASGRENMIAWLAARCDGDNYGKLLVYKYPKDKTVFGPLQVETRIDQDPTISAQLTLWNQSGSRVSRGNTLVIPIGNSNLYVKPIYLQASQGQFPELRRVVVASGNRIAMEPTLDDALARLFENAPASPGAAPPAASAAPPASGGPGLSPAAAALAKSAQDHYTRAQDALRAGDWSRYGEELSALESDLRRLVEATQ